MTSNRETDLRAVADLTAHLAEAAGDIRSDQFRNVAQDAVALFLIGGKLSKIAVNECNRGLSRAEETKRFKLRKAADTIARDYRIPTSHNGDPRGYVFKLKLPSGRYNTMGGAEEGWGVA